MAEGRPDRDPLVGKTLGGCVLEERIGRGGMGSVYRAIRKPDNLRVAIKILSPFMAADEAVVARFTREARAASRIRHPNVVRVLGSALEDGIHFTIMEFVDGENLSELLRREGCLPMGRAVFIAGEVAQGLRALHHEGIIHRDVKPSNILIGRDGSVKITDFGIARDVFEIQRLTATGDLLGTLGFAAPEQLNQSEVDARADLYSLGVTLHYMISGVRPAVNPKAPATPLDKSVPAVLRELVSRLMAKNPTDRPANAASVSAILAPYAMPQGLPSLKRHAFQVGLKVAGGTLAFWAGAAATSSHGLGFHADPWSLVIPTRDSLMTSGALFGSGVLMAFWAFIRGRDRIGLGMRSVVGSTLLAASLVVAYMAGAALGSLTFEDAVLSLISPTPQVLFAEALAAAAFGLFLGMRNQASILTRLIGCTLILLAFGAAETASSAASITQAIDDLRDALARSAWAWMSLVLAGLGIAVSYRYRGGLRQLLLATLAVFISLGLVYWSSLGKGSPSLWDAIAAPAGEIALAIFLALGARMTLELGPGAWRDPCSDQEIDTTASSATPPPAV